MTLLAMSNNDIGSNKNKTGTFIECPMLIEIGGQAKSRGSKDIRYNWTRLEQVVIIGSFYYGYIMTQLPGGYLAEHFGPKWVCGIGTLMSGLICLMTPTAAALGTTALICLRILQGLFQGAAKPSMYTIIGNWSPKLERSRFSTFLMSGSQFGTIIAMPLSGIISSCATLGWPAVFSFFGILTCVWFVFWICFMHDSPWDDPYITKSELQFFGKRNEEIRAKRPIPWKAFFSSMPVWAVIISHFGSGFGLLTLSTELPNYMENVLHFSIKENGTLSALPYILEALTGWISSYIADKLRIDSRLSITAIRKIFNSIGCFGLAFCLMCVTVSGCRPNLIVGLISSAMALNGFSYSGFFVTHVDMSPEFAGTLFGITNSFSTFNGIITPVLVTFLTSSGETIPEWNRVFYIVAVLYMVTATFYIIFASAEKQTWDRDKDDTSSEMALLNKEVSD